MAHLARCGQGLERLDQGPLAATELTTPTKRWESSGSQDGVTVGGKDMDFHWADTAARK